MKNKTLQRNLLYAAGGVSIVGVVVLIVLDLSPRIYMGLSVVAWLLFYLGRRTDSKRNQKI